MAAIIAVTAAPAANVPYSSRQSQQVHQLRQTGEAPSTIAAILGLSTAAVDDYLGIARSNAPSVPGAALIPALANGITPPPGISIFA